MKYVFVACITTLGFMLAHCGMQRELDRDLKNALKNLPGDMSAENKEELTATYHRGFLLYKATCSGCHGTSSRGTDTIPYFSFAQLDNYKSSAANGDPENHAVAKKLSSEQLGEIMSFLFLRTVAKQAEAQSGEKK